MKKSFMQFALAAGSLLFFSAAFSQASSPASLQRKSNIKPGEKAVYDYNFNPTLFTHARPAAGGLSDGVDVRIHPSSNVQAEVIIQLNKTNPSNLLVSANTLVGPFSYNQGYYYSYDGGLTWGGSDSLQNISASKISGDPSIAFSADGTAFLTSINNTGGYWFQTSANGGSIWTAGKKVTNEYSYDKEMCDADDLASSPYANYFYCSWTNFGVGNGVVEINRSTDKGTTFGSIITLRPSNQGFGQGTNVQTGPNGEVYVCYADHKTYVSPYKADGLGFAKSLDGGATFTPYARAFDFKGIRVDGYSNTFNKTRVSDFPSMAVDKSGRRHNGRIYVTYPALQNDTGKSVIYVNYSDDQGTTWSPRVQVSIPDARQSWFPWISVDDSTGLVWVCYYAFDQATGFSTNTYAAASLHGKKWITVPVSDVPHTTAPINNTYFAYGYAGDYIGIAAWGGKAYVTWTDNRNGTWQVYVSPVTATRALLQQLSQEEDNITAVTQSSNVNIKAGPNPFSSYINIESGKEKIASVQLYSQSGYLVKFWKGNLHSVNVADVPKGIYVIKVTLEGQRKESVFSQTLIKQ